MRIANEGSDRAGIHILCTCFSQCSGYTLHLYIVYSMVQRRNITAQTQMQSFRMKALLYHWFLVILIIFNTVSATIVTKETLMMQFAPKEKQKSTTPSTSRFFRTTYLSTVIMLIPTMVPSMKGYIMFYIYLMLLELFEIQK